MSVRDIQRGGKEECEPGRPDSGDSGCGPGEAAWLTAEGASEFRLLFDRRDRGRHRE